MFLMMFVGLGNAAAAVGLVFCSTLAQVSGVLSFDGFTMGFLDTAGKCHKFAIVRRICLRGIQIKIFDGRSSVS